MNKYRKIIGRLPDNPNVERAALAIPDAPDEREMRPAARFAAITAACCMIAVMCFFAWRFMFGQTPNGGGASVPGMGEISGPEDASPPETAPSPVPAGAEDREALLLSMRSGKHTPSYSFDYRVFAGKIPQSYPDNLLAPKWFANGEDLRAFIDENGILEGQGYGEYECTLPETVDFTRQAVIAVYGLASPVPEYLAPIIEDHDLLEELGASGIMISRGMETPYNEEEDRDQHILRGYFLIFDYRYTKILIDKEGNLCISFSKLIYDMASFTDITPDTLREETNVRVYNGPVNGANGLTYTGAYIFQPQIALQNGFECTNAYAAEDNSYVILTHAYPNDTQPIEPGIQREQERRFTAISVTWLGAETRTYLSGPYYDHNLTLEPLGGDRWAVIDETGETAAVMTVTTDGRVDFNLPEIPGTAD